MKNTGAKATAKQTKPSRRHKVQMNRLFREKVGGGLLPFPEVDNMYEKVRSHCIIYLRRLKRDRKRE